MRTHALDDICFTARGSFLAINPDKQGQLVYRTSARAALSEKWMEFWASNFFGIQLVNGENVIPCTWQAQPHRLELIVENSACATFVFADKNTISFEANGVGVRFVPLKPYHNIYSPAANLICVTDWAAKGTHQFRAAQGTTLKTITPTAMQFEGEQAAGAFRFVPYECGWDEPLPDLNIAAQTAEQVIQKWLARLPVVPDRYREAAERAAYLLWSQIVPVGGKLTRPTIFSSKFSMNGVWSWDNCFHALAAAPFEPELAWDQLHLLFDHQDPYGMIPDRVDDQGLMYGFTKPPIYGWTIKKLVGRFGVEASLSHIAALYEPVSRQTDWWYALRDSDHDGMCQYHNGNDSGWDNATVFDQGMPTEGADLAAHLTLQMEGLAFMAGALGKTDEAERWTERSKKQLADLLVHSVENDHFVARLSGNHRTEPSQSLLNYIPLLLGPRLPASIRAALCADLAPNGRYLTDHGLASESLSSPKYESDGYWRGPIWAPSTYLIVEGLIDSGEMSLAHTVADRFCQMAERVGFWENYDALTGQGLRCPGVAWSNAVFLLLAEWLASVEAAAG